MKNCHVLIQIGATQELSSEIDAGMLFPLLSFPVLISEESEQQDAAAAALSCVERSSPSRDTPLRKGEVWREGKRKGTPFFCAHTWPGL